MMPKDWQHSQLKLVVLIVLSTVLYAAGDYLIIVLGQRFLHWFGTNELTGWIFTLVFGAWLFFGWFLIFRELDWRLG